MPGSVVGFKVQAKAWTYPRRKGNGWYKSNGKSESARGHELSGLRKLL